MWQYNSSSTQLHDTGFEYIEWLYIELPTYM